MLMQTDTAYPPAICIMGPTASGKTELAVELVERLPLEIISVDSAMVYRGMDIGTAKPDAEILARAPHHLVDIVDPSVAYSAARFRDDALQEMATIHAAGRVPLLVGGTMLYFRALQHGLAELPAADPAVRAELEAEAAQKGWATLHSRLGEVDPESAQRIHPNDPQRIQRALEVYTISGRPLSAWLQDAAQTAAPFALVKLALAEAEREQRRIDIARRFQTMLDQGLVAEVETLFQRGDLYAELPSMRAVGYRQIWEYLDARCDYETMREKAITATRQLAKRQMTWLRAEQELNWFDSRDPSRLDRVLKLLQAAPINWP